MNVNSKELTFGDHIMLIGEEVLDATYNPEKQSLIYHDGRSGLYNQL